LGVAGVGAGVGLVFGMAFPGLAAEDAEASTIAVFPAFFESLGTVVFVSFSCFGFAIKFEGAPKIEREYLAAFNRSCKGNIG